MKKRNLILALSVSCIVALVGCNDSTDTNSTDTTSGEIVVPPDPPVTNDTGTSEDPSEDDSGTEIPPEPVDPLDLFDQAMSKDYPNITAKVGQYYDKGENEEYNIEYYYKDYQIVESDLNDNDPYLYYHNYKDSNYLWFGPDKGAPNGAWLDKGMLLSDDSQAVLSIWNTYFYLPLFTSSLTSSDVEFVTSTGDMNIFQVKGSEKIDELNKNAFGFAWFNNLTDFLITVDNEGNLTGVDGYDDINDNSDNADMVQVRLIDQGETIFDYSKLPEAPNETNVMEYWQYKGYDGPECNTYITDISLTPDTSATVEDGKVVVDIEGEALLRSSYLPTDANIVDITWHSSDESIVKLDYGSETGTRKVVGVSAGEATVWATSEHNDVVSNVITVKVNPLQEQNREGCVYDLSFTGITDEGVIGTNNALNNNLPLTVTGKVGNVKVQEGQYSDIWEDNEQVIIMNPSEQSTNGESFVTFDFDDQEVSTISLYYGFYYSSRGNEQFLQEAVIETSEDGITWGQVKDIKEQVCKASSENKKLLEESFAPASKVRIRLKMNMLGTPIHFAFSGALFNADDSCHAHEEKPATVDVESVSIQTSKDEIRVNQSTTITSVVLPSDATDKTLSWSCSNQETVSLVDNGDGSASVTGLAEGQVTLKATSVNGVVSNELTITVLPELVLDNELLGKWKGEDDHYNEWLFTIAGTTLNAKGEDGQDVNLELTDLVDRYYVFTAGEDTISIKASTGYDDQAEVKGKIGDLQFGQYTGNRDFNRYREATSLSLSASKTTLTVGQSVSVVATFDPTNTTSNAKELTWTSSDETIATVEANGTVNAIGQGVATITASTSYGVSSTIDITVIPVVEVSSIALSAPKTEIEVKETLQITATVLPNDATNPDIVDWTSSDSSVATVNKSGLVTGVSAGSVTIKAKSANGVEGSITITVTQASDKLPSELCGTWHGSDDWCQFDFTIVISADGSLTLIEDSEAMWYGTELEFELSSQEGDEYVFTSSDNNSSNDITITLTDDGITVTWEDDYTSMYGFEGSLFTK